MCCALIAMYMSVFNVSSCLLTQLVDMHFTDYKYDLSCKNFEIVLSGLEGKWGVIEDKCLGFPHSLPWIPSHKAKLAFWGSWKSACVTDFITNFRGQVTNSSCPDLSAEPCSGMACISWP